MPAAHSRGDVEVGGLHELHVDAAVVGRFAPDAVEAVGDLPQAGGAGDVGDAAVSERDEVAGCERAARDVVDGDRGVGAGGDVAVDDDPGDAVLGETLQMWPGVPDRAEEHPADALLFEQGQVGVLTVGLLGAVAHQDGDAVFGCALLGAGGHVVEEGVGGVEDDQPDAVAEPRAELACGFVADEPEGGDRLVDSLAGGAGDPVGSVEHVGDGADRDPGGRCHVLDPHGAAMIHVRDRSEMLPL